MQDYFLRELRGCENRTALPSVFDPRCHLTKRLQWSAALKFFKYVSCTEILKLWELSYVRTCQRRIKESSELLLSCVVIGHSVTRTLGHLIIHSPINPSLSHSLTPLLHHSVTRSSLSRPPDRTLQSLLCDFPSSLGAFYTSLYSIIQYFYQSCRI